MTVVATIITGADPAFDPLLKQFARALLQTEDCAIIHQPKVEGVLAGAVSPYWPDPRLQFTLLDVLQTKASDAAHQRHSEHCLLIGDVDCERGSERFERWEDLLIMGSEEVRSWGLFRSCFIACLTPGRRVEPVVRD